MATDSLGISSYDRERIFEPYQRSKPEDGLTAAIGVGLTVARRPTRLIDGDLTYEHDDGFSRFTMTLPAMQTEAASVTPGLLPSSDTAGPDRPYV